MKHLVSGIAIAAALVVAAPMWAQAQGPKASGGGNIPASPPPAAAAAPMAPMAPMAPKTAGKQRHKRPMRHMASKTHMAGKRHMGKMSAGDAMTDQLNREELTRLQGGGAMPPPPPAAGPRPSGH